MRLLIATIISFFIITAGSHAEKSPARSAKIYSVVFAFSVDAEGQLKEFRVSEVVDVRSGSTNPVDVKVPESYIEVARAEFMKRSPKPTIEEGKLVEKFTYFYFDPRQPARTDAGLLMER